MYFFMQNKEPFVPNFVGRFLNVHTTTTILSILLLGTLTLGSTPAFSQNEEAPISKSTLQLLHAADMEGGIEALENAPRFSSVLNALKAEIEDTVIIGAGDSYIPGPFFAAANNGSLREVLGREGSGRADILMLNAMGFMVGALGNHEFDAGTGTLAGLIAADRDYVGTAFPFLSANLDFSPDSNLAALHKLNMISLPLMPSEPYTARAFMKKTGATTVVEYNPAAGSFIGFTANSDGNGFPIEGGKDYIVNVTAPKTVRFIGSAWQNTAPTVAAAPRLSSSPKTWAFVLRAQLEGISGVTLTVYNGPIRVAEAVDANNFHAAWADMNRQAVVSAGDMLTVEVRDTMGDLIRTLQHEISVTDIHRAFTELRLTPADLIPKRPLLLANYPNPFNPETWLPYQLANDAEVTIRIYSSAGHLVRQLDLGFQQAGYYIGKARAAYWDGRNDLGEDSLQAFISTN